MMVRSLNFWLFLVALICGISFWIASGTPLPAGFEFKETGGIFQNFAKYNLVDIRRTLIVGKCAAPLIILIFL